ncbi:DUF6538 domain-containing protein [Kordiimonas pumila]|uniref:DUF6538 domain-containing protein n=1 Tax=Kordiimonas pumila TaxID=2161677 RepID=A0ABV7D6K3_9PROT|nr:DUF6538 domain-containing protein [Kordiimonas pumila]
MAKPDRYLMLRGDRWYYKRRVPEKYRAYDERDIIKQSLGTDSREIARLRRDALEQADNDYWAAVAFNNDETASAEQLAQVRGVLDRKYQAACSRALAHGFIYSPAMQLVQTADVGELVDRVKVVTQASGIQPGRVHQAEADALLGGIDEPTLTVLEAFDLYCDTIAVGDLLNKSPKQKKSWKKSKQRAINYFVGLCGNKPILEITRSDAQAYYNWWAERLLPTDGQKPLKANTANRDLGNMRTLCREYFNYIGQETRDNPFRLLSFKNTSPTEVPPFEDDWVRSKILKRGALGDLNKEALYIVYTLIETGCRPSEVANLLPENIILDAEVPYLDIRPRAGVEIKTQSSTRKIPLVGVSLEAMKRAPHGFPRYRDKGDALSQLLMKEFRIHKLFPTDSHIIYSFRHSFEKRMLEAGLDYDFRCLMMGHKNTRPKYGDGGSMKFRQEQLLKIVHPYPKDIFG